METIYPLKNISIGTSRIGEGCPCFIIAEAGVNHNGNLAMALKLVDAAVDCGADAIKFQKRNLSKIYPEELLNNPNSAEWSFQYMLPILKETELSFDDFREIKDHCAARKIMFLCTPWDEDSLVFLETLGTPAYKVSSADLINIPLLDRIAATGKPLILSTGMAIEKEVDVTVNYLKLKNIKFAILHCVSTYPAPFENLNLSYIQVLKKYGVPIGYSSHERGIAMPIVALTLGAAIIEKHITLDRSLPGPDHPASLEPAGLSKMVRDIRNAEKAMGRPVKNISTMEMMNRQVLRKSIVATCSIKKGTVFSAAMVRVTGPGKGISPQRMPELLGKVVVRDIEKDHFFGEADFISTDKNSINAANLKKPWGFKCRFHDLQQYMRFNPILLEIHFGEKDINTKFVPPDKPYRQRLFLHAPEFINNRLVNLCSDNKNQRQISIDLLQSVIDKASELAPSFNGSVGIVIHVGGMDMDQEYKDVDHLVDRAAEGLLSLNLRGCIILPENLPPRPWYLGGQWYQNVFTHADHMIMLCKKTGFGMTLDISHAQLFCTYVGQSLSEYVKSCLPYVRHVHMGDASGIDGEGLQIGDGDVNWKEVLTILKDIDYTWVPEIWSGHLNNGDGFFNAIQKLAVYDLL